MEEPFRILPPANEGDSEGAQRVFEEFLTLYQPALVRMEYYLEQVMEQAEPAFAEAYRPWHKALRDLYRGVYLLARRMPLPDSEAFVEALRMFSFGSSVRFLRDICLNCRLSIERDWAEHFRAHIDMLLFSLSILTRQQASLAR